jgi:hypothetical protein
LRSVYLLYWQFTRFTGTKSTNTDTLDGSERSRDRGALARSGDVVALRRSAEIKTLAYVDPAAQVSVRQSRVVRFPYIKIRIARPSVTISDVGHYRRLVCGLALLVYAALRY